MIYKLEWNEHGPGVINALDIEICSDIFKMQVFVERLEMSGYNFVALTKEGVIYKDSDFLAEPLIPDILLKEDKPTEVTGEFFLFYDHLPEHIKKEIKIYINKTEE